MLMVQSAKIRNVRSPATAIFLLAFLTIAGAWIAVCLLSRRPAEHALIQFLVLSLLMVLATVSVIWCCKSMQFRLPFWWVLATAAVLRLVSLGGEPLFEDDFYRYLWDGYQTVVTNDPYTFAPYHFFDQDVPEVFESVLSYINYPEIATVYGPVNQGFFALAYLIAPAQVWPLQLMSGLADLLIICLLWRLGAGNSLLLYAWSPLILKEFSLTAHPDVFAIGFMLLSVLAVWKRQAYLAGIALALAIGAKVFALLVIPFLLTCGWVFRQWVQMALAAMLCLALMTAWFGSLTIWVPEGLLAMADSWLFNSPLYYLLLPVLDFQMIKSALAVGFVVYAIVAFYHRVRRDWSSATNKPVRPSRWVDSSAAFRGDWLFALFLLSLPVINPWYVAWTLPFATLYPRCWSWTTSYAILLSYWYGHHVGAVGADSLQLPAWVLVLEYAIIGLVPILFGMYRRHPQSNSLGG